MLILGIDSSTKVGSASLFLDGRLVGEILLNLEQTHSQGLMPAIVDLLKNCQYDVDDLSGIGVSLGPGSFTGTRIGLTTAKTLSQSLGIPIVGISTLEVMAYGLKYANGYICPMIDARRERVFTSLYKAEIGQLEVESKEVLIALDDLLADLSGIDDKIYFVGEVAALYQKKIREEIKRPQFVMASFNLPRAAFYGELASERLADGGDELFTLTPNYLKRSQAEIQWEKKHNG